MSAGAHWSESGSASGTAQKHGPVDQYLGACSGNDADS